MKKGTLHTKKYRLLSLLIVLTMLSSHMAPIYCATDGMMEQKLSVSTGTEPTDTDNRTLICQIAEHTHDDVLCWQQNLICGMEVGDYHVHGETCTQEVSTLTCTLTEQQAHAHTDICYGPVEKIVCTLEEVAAHTHGEGCYTAKDTVICGQEAVEAHTHTDACKGTEKKLICTLKEEEAHIHSDACKGEEKTLSCTLTETAGHTHGDACKDEPKLTCTLAEDGTHTHESACYAAAEYVCGLEEAPAHTHGDDCYTITVVNKCGKEETAGHTHGETCYIDNEIYTCGLEETAGHSHAPECYRTEQELTCKLAETEGHTHSEACKAYETGLVCKLETSEGHAHSDACYTKTVNPVCTLPIDVPHEHDETCYGEEKTLICQQVEHAHGDSCYQSAQPAGDVLTDRVLDALYRYVTVSGSLPEDVTLTASVYDVRDYDDLKAQVIDYLRDGEQVAFGYDISLVRTVDGVEEVYQPEGAVNVMVKVPTSVLTQLGYDSVEALAENLNLYHVHEDEVESLSFEADDSTGTLCFDVEQFSVFVGTIKSGTSVYLVQQLGYTLYQGETVLSAQKLEWKSGVTITVKPDTGYQLTDVTVVDKQTGVGSSCANVAKNNDGTYTITYVSTPAGDLLIQVEVTQQYNDGYVYFDLSAGNVTITGNHYVGYRFDGQTTAQKIEGDLGAGQSYYVYQSDKDDYGTGLIGTEMVLPEHDRVTYGGKSWGEYITNNTDVNAVIGAWNSATSGNRAATPNLIDIKGKTDAVMIIDSLWSSDHTHGASAISGGIRFIPGSSVTGASLTLYLKGDNRFGNVFYNSSAGTDILADNLLIFDGDADATLTAANLTQNTNTNYWRSAIGGNDGGYGHAKGIVINNGIIYAGTTVGDDCTAIGGGGNDQGIITINGGTVTAVCSSSGTAIGGGIGKSAAGGQAAIFINGGKTYAYNFSCASRGFTDYGVKYIPAAAIGGGSSGKSTCNKSTVIITGGEVYAQSVGGTAIGGGSSADTHGGDADIIISGGKVYAKSVDGYIDGQYVPAGAAIGGGTGGDGGQVAGKGKGGNVTLTISGDAYVETGSIGGGSTINKAETIGYAQVNIDGGQTYGQIIMAAGSSSHCTFTMTGGELHQPKSGYAQLQNDGAAVWMDDSDGIADMSGGTISGCQAQNGGAVYMTAGTFTLSGDGEISGNTATEDGGAVYMGGGVMNVSGGIIKNNSSANDGGAIYMGGGELNISDGIISNNAATQNGGGAYVNDGNIYMSGGEVSNNTATSGAGGGMYVSADKQPVKVKIFSGTVSGNTAATGGGAVAVYGAESGGQNVTVQTGVEGMHYDADGNRISFAHGKTKGDDGTQYTHNSCPVISDNTAGEKGGAIHIKGDNLTTNLNIYCVEESGNETDGDALSTFLMVDGGRVVISSATDETIPGVDTEPDSGEGAINVNGTVHVSGGQVDLYGVMTNPGFGETISVDITKAEDYFKDHRYNIGYYKLQYFENFVDPVTKVRSGRYTAVQVPMGETSTIRPVMYSHPGYDIKGWNTRADGSDSYRGDHTQDPSGWYNVGDEILFRDVNGDNNSEVQDLILYAIWEANIYWVCFDDNVPAGQSFDGEMEDQRMEFDVKAALNENQFSRAGYQFTGWNTEPDGTGEALADKAEVLNLCKNKNEKYYLYAQWEVCEHNPNKVGEKPACKFTYTVDGDTLVRTCECKGQVVKVKLSAKDTTYEWKNGAAVEHPATKTGPTVTKGEWYNGIDWDPTVYYARRNGSGWSLMVNTDGTPIVPTDAGEYLAAIVDDEDPENDDPIVASVTYTIEKAEQPMPQLSEPVVNGNTMTVTDAGSSKKAEDGTGSDIKIQYQLFYYKGGELFSQELQDNNTFTLPAAYTSYYVEAFYTEGNNHKRSPVAKSFSIFHIGNTKIEFDVEEGIEYTSYNVNVTGDADGMQILVKAKDGYYLTEGFSVTAKSATEDYSTFVRELEPKVKYLINGVPDQDGLVITVYIKGAAQKAGITATVAEKREYGAVEKRSINVSRDSAFTAYYEVVGYNETYTGLALEVAALPKGTTILMMDKSDPAQTTYWHYEASGGETKILLEAFTRMGTENTKFTEPTSGNLNYQFVVDYSWTTAGCSTDPDMKLTAEKVNPSSLAPVFADLYEAPAVTMKDPESFTMEKVAGTAEKELTQTLQLTYEPSSGAASRWEGRAAALVLTFVPEQDNTGAPIKDLPADALMRTTVTKNGKSSSVRWPLCNSSSGMYFIIPLEDVGTADLFTLKLESELFPTEAKTYQFNAEWI